VTLPTTLPRATADPVATVGATGSYDVRMPPACVITRTGRSTIVRTNVTTPSAGANTWGVAAGGEIDAAVSG
jgi:hypothetical protein